MIMVKWCNELKLELDQDPMREVMPIDDNDLITQR